MAEQLAKASQYEYRATSNLVLQADRSLITRRGDESTGEVETLVGRVDAKKMGDRALRSKPKSLVEATEKDKQKRERKREREERENYKQKSSFSSVLSATEDFEGLVYRPKTKETRATYEQILSFIHKYLGEQPQDILRGAADEVLAVLKNDALKDIERKREIESVLASLTPESFNQLVNLGKKITDYSTSTEGADGTSAVVDSEIGVAVVFDEESEDEEGEAYEIKGDSEPEEEGEETSTSLTLGQAGGESIDSAAEKPAVDLTLNPQDIDAFWLQREIGKYYADAVTSQKMTKSVLETLQVAKDARDCENKLVLLLDYDKFDLVKLLTRNRSVVLYCTRLGQAQTAAERQNIETEMKDDPKLALILQALKKDESRTTAKAKKSYQSWR